MRVFLRGDTMVRPELRGTARPANFHRQSARGARQATGAVAIIDVFRAFTTAAVALANGASEIIMVGASRRLSPCVRAAARRSAWEKSAAARRRDSTSATRPSRYCTWISEQSHRAADRRRNPRHRRGTGRGLSLCGLADHGKGDCEGAPLSRRRADLLGGHGQQRRDTHR